MSERMCMFGIVCSKTLDKLQLDHLISYSKDYLSKKQSVKKSNCNSNNDTF